MTGVQTCALPIYVPRSIIMVLITVLVMYASISVIALSVMPVHQAIKDPETKEVVWNVNDSGEVVDPVTDQVEGKLVGDDRILTKSGEVIPAGGDLVNVTDLSERWLQDPVMGIVKDQTRGVASVLPTLAKVMAVWVGILAATILLIATNAGILGISRLSYSMGQHKQLPPILGRLSSRFQTPYTAIIFAGVVAAVLILPGRVDLLADLYSFGAMIGFTSAHLSVIMLRIKEPDLHRPFKAPLNFHVRGVELPLTAIIGGICTFSVWVIVLVTHELGRYVGIIWLIIGFTIYIAYRRSQNLSLLDTVKEEPPVALQFPDVEYNNILVPLIGSKITREALVMACELASEENASIFALSAVEVPLNLPIDTLSPDEAALAQKLLDDAEEVADEFGVKLFKKIIPGRPAGIGRVIVDEAIKTKSQIIMIGAERKRRVGERFFGRTVEYVLRKAPCKVLVVAEEKVLEPEEQTGE